MSGIIRSSLGPMLKSLSDIVTEIAPFMQMEAIEDRELPKLDSKAKSLRKLLERIEKKNSEWIRYIQELDKRDRPEEEAKFENFVYATFTVSHWMEKGQTTLDWLEQILENKDPNPGNNQRQGQNQRNNAPEGNGNIATHLEKMSLPTFKGDPHEWNSYFQTFKSMVDQTNYDPVIKLHYLLNSLRGEAKENVQDISISGDNYKIVMDILQHKYGDPIILSETLQAELFKMQQAQDSNISVKKTVDKIEKIFRQLKALNQDVESNTLLGLIKSKLPRWVLVKLAEKEALEAEKWTTSEFRKELVKLVNIQESVYQSTKNFHGTQKKFENENEQSSRKPTFGREFEETRSFQLFNSQKSNEGQRLNCLFCEGNHPSYKCAKVWRRQDRLQRLANLNRCFRCLRSDHFAAECQSNKQCSICNGKHHIVICPRAEKSETQPGNSRNFETFSDKPRATGANLTPIGCKANLIQNPSVFKSNPHITQENEEEQNPELKIETLNTEQTNNLTLQNLNENRLGDTILMARKVFVSSPRDPNKVEEVILFFDSGSQTSYITERLVRKLRPPKIGQELLEVKTFKSDDPLRFRSGKHLLDIHCLNGHKEQVLLYSTSSFAKSFRFVHLKRLNESMSVAEITQNLELLNQEPDILLGVAEFWKFFLSKTTLAPEFYLVQTTIGPIVCGRKQWSGPAWQTPSHVSVHPDPVSPEIPIGSFDFNFMEQSSSSASLPKIAVKNVQKESEVKVKKVNEKEQCECQEKEPKSAENEKKESKGKKKK